MELDDETIRHVMSTGMDGGMGPVGTNSKFLEEKNADIINVIMAGRMKSDRGYDRQE